MAAGSRSGYMLFAEEVRDEIRAEVQNEGGSGSVAQVGKRTGEKWRALEQSTRDQYNARAAAEQQNRHDNGDESGLHNTTTNTGMLEEEDAGANGAAGTSSAQDSSGIPLARVKRIAKLDKEVGQLSSDAVKGIKRAAEIFVETLAAGCAERLQEKSRKGGVRYQDLEDTVLRQPRLGFLQDHVYAMRPREGAKPTSHLPGAQADASGRNIADFFSYEGQQQQQQQQQEEEEEEKKEQQQQQREEQQEQAQEEQDVHQDMRHESKLVNTVNEAQNYDATTKEDATGVGGATTTEMTDVNAIQTAAREQGMQQSAEDDRHETDGDTPMDCTDDE